ncbi:hypothetical protein H696_01499 [Fonticula alba]|uniref:Saposin B-type domain-containing protein n=1 Tax=Fonticula alba TaxID=691883 RepID=A0A058ZF32_FONAL|nr:hypothetical protein H696_01499 [Fonticula alba]KCV72092.1 hypothetical protein H696_01499 [Fonticula alba]|eukprot:XP_009493670.1 hypothetical protein H696_01499 [Fonticula alba]
MRALFNTLIALVALFAMASSAFAMRDNDGGGTTCAVCTVVVGLAQQMQDLATESAAYKRFVPARQIAAAYCNNMAADSGLNKICKHFFFNSIAGPGLMRAIDASYFSQAPISADQICRSAGFCTNSKCNLFSKMSRSLGGSSMAAVDVEQMASPEEDVDPAVFSEDAVAEREELVRSLCATRTFAPFCNWGMEGDTHTAPLVDQDKDGIGPTDGSQVVVRGSQWRGADCDDKNPNVYPGRKATTLDAKVDHDCNGVVGIDSATKRSYEDLFCSGFRRMGVIGIGDSATAHFHIPDTWLNATTISREAFDSLTFIATNELDWPQQSTASSFVTSPHRDCPGPLDSIYGRLRERNLCNHRDFQNIGVNGADVVSTVRHIKTLARNKASDHPVLVLFALIGNDICSSNPSVSSMTTPQQFEASVRESLKYLDENTPAGSKVLIEGIVDGRVLYQHMHDQIHPLGVKFSTLYDYLNCLKISPCAGWLNSNADVRNASSNHAAKLNDVYRSILKNTTFRNIEVDYIDYPIAELITRWVSRGGKAVDLIDNVDGFHPSQVTNALLSEYVWEFLMNKHPSWLGDLNPNNSQIRRLFGDQGGY